MFTEGVHYSLVNCVGGGGGGGGQNKEGTKLTMTPSYPKAP